MLEPKLCGLPMKYVALVMLVAQTVTVILFLRKSRQVTGPDNLMYLNTTAVVMSETIKFFCSLGLLIREERSIRIVVRQIKEEVIMNPTSTLKVGVPALLYTVQNNLNFVALSHIPGAIYQPTYQLKIMTTAIMSVIILRRTISLQKWCALAVLTLGVVLVQWPSDETPITYTQLDLMIGLVAVLSSCVTSGVAGVLLEKILKNTKSSIWLRNIQLSIFGVVLGLVGVIWNDGPAVADQGFFQGYTAYTWIAITLMSAGGLIIALVLKHADNLLKCFGNAAAIGLSCLVSYWLNDFQPSAVFFVGCSVVVYATYVYNIDPSRHFQRWILCRSTKKTEIEV
ncbi:MAG: uncharacterized protein KVP18_002273 [Porospora cf. gigantea A]|uniref:uncharacterized protein n=1 Tax=Porospora cf. gigantea A TaxID=2853593 RepID=UPI0035599393|nr:MAG: hypothetical protein KVP18_002273 [Porospora cf. gigantea A]